MVNSNYINEFNYMVMFEPNDSYDTVTLKLFNYYENLERTLIGTYTIKEEILDVLNVNEYALYPAEILMDADLNIVCPNQDSRFDAEEQFEAVAELRRILDELRTINNKDKEYLNTLNQDGLDDYICSSLYIPKEAVDSFNKFGIYKIWQLLLIDQSILHILPGMNNERVNAVRQALKEHGYNLRDTVKVESGKKIERKELNHRLTQTHTVISIRPMFVNTKPDLYKRVDKETQYVLNNK